MVFCPIKKPFYNENRCVGLESVSSGGDGYSMVLKFRQARPDSINHKVAYNIYHSTIRDDVYTEGVKGVVIDPSQTTTTLVSFSPGDLYYFSVRATQFDVDDVNTDLLPNGPTTTDGYLKIYSEGAQLSSISKTDLTIPVSDIELFPAFGIVQIGYELIKYTNVDLAMSELVLSDISGRGFLGTDVRIHDIDGYDGYVIHDPTVTFWKGFQENNTVVFQAESRFAHPNVPCTIADGYRMQEDCITTDLSVSDANQEDNPRYPFDGWHRTDPLSLLRGDCLDSYIGGEQGCADGYGGVGQQVRGINLVERDQQRLEVLIETTGSPTVLFKRIWDGVTCSCVTISKESPELRCKNCFVPDTLVRTEEGYKKISDINVGDRVLTSESTYQKVTKVFVSDFDGYLSSIMSSVNTSAILTTPEHPFLTLRGLHSDNIKRFCGPKCDTYIQNGDGVLTHNLDIRQLPSGLWHARVTTQGNRKTLGSFVTPQEAEAIITAYKKENISPGHEIKWDEAKNIDKNDWLIPTWNKDIKDLDTISIPQEFRKNTNIGMQRFGANTFVVDNDFMWMIGLYLAEGSASNRTVTFSLHEEEIEYQNRLVEYFNRYEFNVSIYSAKNSKGITVNIHSTSLAGWFKSLMGGYCYEKKIPEKLMKLPIEKTWVLIRGIHDGDGSKRDSEITQTSEILALQIAELLHRIGEQPLIRRQKSNILTPIGNSRRMAYTVSWAEKALGRENRKGRWRFEDKMLAKVNNVEKIPYKGKVYNLEVEGDHTYIVNGIVVHNCFGTGFIGGYHQFFNPRRSDRRIMVRFDPAEEDIKVEEAGLESYIIHQCWTLATPSLDDRDVLIQYDEAGIEMWRYEILAVTRNILIDSKMGRQMFKVQRIRKSSPIYMLGSLGNAATMPSVVNTSISMEPGLPPHSHEIVINENITNIAQINQTTSLSAGHTHQVRNGVVLDVGLNHGHNIVLI